MVAMLHGLRMSQTADRGRSFLMQASTCRERAGSIASRVTGYNTLLSPSHLDLRITNTQSSTTRQRRL